MKISAIIQIHFFKKAIDMKCNVSKLCSESKTKLYHHLCHVFAIDTIDLNRYVYYKFSYFGWRRCNIVKIYLKKMNAEIETYQVTFIY